MRGFALALQKRLSGRCGAGGTAIDALVARGSNLANAFEELRRCTSRGGGGTPSKTRAHVHTSGCTVERYAEAKCIPADFLRELGVSDYIDSRFTDRVLRIPYRDRDGNEPAVRLRVALTKATTAITASCGARAHGPVSMGSGDSTRERVHVRTLLLIRDIQGAYLISSE
jgi:hypothetical protein